MPFRRILSLLGFSLLSALARPLPRDPDILSYQTLRPEVVQSSTSLLVSNSPETVPSPGLLYRDRIQGAARVLAYHVNGLPAGGPDQAARLLIVARNSGQAPSLVTLTRRGSARSNSPDPLIGQQTLLRYFASGPLPSRTTLPGETLTLFDSGPLRRQQVVSVLLDLYADHEVQISVYLLRGAERPGPQTPELAPDGSHQRGTFAGADRSWHVRLPALLPQTPFRLMFSDQSDLPLAGTDALTGRPQLLKGNFGVLYDVTVEGAAGYLLAASARGGAYRGSLKVQDGPRTTPLLIGRGLALKDAALPEAVWSIRTDTFRLALVPASGSNLPLALVIYPPAMTPSRSSP